MYIHVYEIYAHVESVCIIILQLEEVKKYIVNFNGLYLAIGFHLVCVNVDPYTERGKE